jgi:hypothetical protein
MRRHQSPSVPPVERQRHRQICFGKSSGARHAAALLKTFAAQYRSSLGGTERNGRLFPALRAVCPRFGFRERVPVRSHAGTGRPFAFAVLAAFGFVLELLVVEEQLFSGCKHEIRSAVDALQNLVLEFHCKRRSHSPNLLSTGDPNGKDPVHDVGRRLRSPRFRTLGFGPPAVATAWNYNLRYPPEIMWGF